MKNSLVCAIAGVFFPLLAVQAADSSPETPHQLSQNESGAASATEDAHRVTIAQARRLADGASVQIQGTLEQKKGEDVYLLRDNSAEIDAIIPSAVFNNAAVRPGDSVLVQGALDKKQTPYRLRVSQFKKR